MIGIVLGVGILLLLILAHEVGHLVAARLCGIPVVSFSIGIGPSTWECRRGDTTYRLALLPLGGYIRYHEGALEHARRPWALACVYLAGPAANVVTAAILLAVAGVASGSPGAILAAFSQTAHFGAEIVRGFVTVVGTADFGQLGGPILIAQWAGAAAESGMVPLLRLAAVLSMNLAIFNLLTAAARSCWRRRDSRAGRSRGRFSAG
jgi:membrane-associated protease RseP (regulator of RpoE activity)